MKEEEKERDKEEEIDKSTLDSAERKIFIKVGIYKKRESSQKEREIDKEKKS